MKGIAAKQNKLERRHRKIRARLSGTAARPRLSVYKSNRFIVAQLIDDEAGTTLVAGSTAEFMKEGTKVAAAKRLGLELASRAKEKKIEAVVFDRGGFRFAGRVAAVAEGAREGGLTF